MEFFGRGENNKDVNYSQYHRVFLFQAPREISRGTKFLIDRGASIKVTLSNDRYYKSPLVQGGMEIEWKIIGSTPSTYDLLLMEKHEK